MNRAEIIEFINSNPASHLATVDGTRPRVRGMLIYRADEEGILFHTGASKDLYKQLLKNPNVELCFNNYKDNIQVRVSGQAEEVKDGVLKKEIVEARPFMKPWVEQYGEDMLAVFKVKNAIAIVWTMEANFASKSYVALQDRRQKIT
jgi:pyridoxamine 5'-phosphate oxidase